MTNDRSDREIVDELAATLSEDEREALDDLERGVRLRAKPQALFVNCGTGEMISPSGIFSDKAISDLKRKYAADRERFRREFGGAA
jgi:hypothetical protein